MYELHVCLVPDEPTGPHPMIGRADWSTSGNFGGQEPEKGSIRCLFNLVNEILQPGNKLKEAIIIMAYWIHAQIK